MPETTTTSRPPSPPFTPLDLVLADPPDDAEGPRRQGAIEQALADSDHEAAHRLAEQARDAAETWTVAATFYLRRQSGRRGARRLLRWARAARTGQASPLRADAADPICAWAHFRLRRHGRALAGARSAVAAMRLEPPQAGDAARWAQSLEAIRTLGLREGLLGLAQRAHEQQVALLALADDALSPDCWEAAQRHMSAVNWLRDHLREHGLPTSLVRYLARSLGHERGHSRVAFVELVSDLGLEPKHLDEALIIAEQYGFGPRIEKWFDALRSRRFEGNWRRRQRAQRAVLLGLYILAALFGLFALVVLVNIV